MVKGKIYCKNEWKINIFWKYQPFSSKQIKPYKTCYTTTLVFLKWLHESHQKQTQSFYFCKYPSNNDDKTYKQRNIIQHDGKFRQYPRRGEDSCCLQDHNNKLTWNNLPIYVKMYAFPSSPWCVRFRLYIRDITIYGNGDRDLGQGRMWHHGCAVELVVEMEIGMPWLTLPVRLKLQRHALHRNSRRLYLQYRTVVFFQTQSKFTLGQCDWQCQLLYAGNNLICWLCNLPVMNSINDKNR